MNAYMPPAVSKHNEIQEEYLFRWMNATVASRGLDYTREVVFQKVDC